MYFDRVPSRRRVYVYSLETVRVLKVEMKQAVYLTTIHFCFFGRCMLVATELWSRFGNG
jgi:hypothetical protein